MKFTKDKTRKSLRIIKVSLHHLSCYIHGHVHMPKTHVKTITFTFLYKFHDISSHRKYLKKFYLSLYLTLITRIAQENLIFCATHSTHTVDSFCSSQTHTIFISFITKIPRTLHTHTLISNLILPYKC